MNKTEIAKAFNDYFSEIGENLVSRLPEVAQPLMCQIIADFCIRLYPTNGDEFPKIKTNPADNHSSGADAISNVILKSIAQAIMGTMVKLINYSLVTGVFPEQLAMAKVIRLYKKGSNEELTNYTPISLLLTFGKIVEKVVHIRVYKFLTLKKFFHCKQFGFGEDHKTVDAIAEVTEKLRWRKKRIRV